jgi:peptidoglycan-N-acetylmuramic acid deacetylase
MKYGGFTMYKKALIFVIAFLVSLSFYGCKGDLPIKEKPIEIVVTPSPSKTANPTSSPTAKPTIKTSPTITPMPTKTPTTNLSTNRLSFGYIPNEDNFPVSINKDLNNLLNKYNSFYIDKKNKKNIYLTMDEGYENGYTSDILDTLKQKGVQCAFFITKQYLDKNEGLVKRMIDEGHIVGNHTVSHPSLPTINNEKVVYEIKALHDAVLDKFAYKMNYFRTPNGEFSQSVLSIINSLGYSCVFWSFAYRDWEIDNQKGADYAFDKVIKGVHNGCILLLHAVSKDNKDALPSIIDELRNKGYIFSSLNNISN